MTMNEKRVSIKGKVSIGATVLYPDENKQYPAVVLIMGTGKTDRDGNEKSFKTDLYKNLANMFAEFGFVCVRYDKRGTFETEGDYNTAGLLLFGGAATSMKDALLYQNYLAAEEFANKKGLLGALLKKQASKEKMNAKVEGMFQKCASAKKDRVFFGGAMLNAKWVKEHAAYSSEDFVELLKQYGKPILAITGTADISTDYRRLSVLSEIPNAECFTPQNVNHILREIDDDNSMMTVKKQYARLSAQPIHFDTKQRIKDWLGQFKA